MSKNSLLAILEGAGYSQSEARQTVSAMICSEVAVGNLSINSTLKEIIAKLVKPEDVVLKPSSSFTKKPKPPLPKFFKLLDEEMIQATMAKFNKTREETLEKLSDIVWCEGLYKDREGAFKKNYLKALSKIPYQEHREYLMRTYDEVKFYVFELIGVRKDSKCGFIDAVGNVVVPLQYDDYTPFNDFTSGVTKDGKEGMVHKTGKELIPCVYDRVYPPYKAKFLRKDYNGNVIYDDSVDYTFFYYHVIEKDSKFGIVDCAGKIIADCIFTEATQAWAITGIKVGIEEFTRYSVNSLDFNPVCITVNNFEVKVLAKSMPGLYTDF